jgi:transaldolase
LERSTLQYEAAGPAGTRFHKDSPKGGIVTLQTQFKSPLHQTVATTKTDFWNDSCSIGELSYAIEHGAVGATSNPTIVEQVLRLERELWDDRIHELISENPDWTEEDVMWKVFEEIGVKGAEQLLPVFEREKGKKGRLSIQTNPTNYRNVEKMVDQAVHFASLAPNMQVKLPVTSKGIVAIEEATYRGINVNATVSFTVPQAIAVGEAVDRGIARREAEGLTTDNMTPVCTIMVGRTDDWMHVVTKRDGITVNPSSLPWAGVAVFKQAYSIYEERGFRARLLAAAYRHHLHWSELIGADAILTIPSTWQKLFNSSQIEVRERMHDPVDPEIVTELKDRIPDFRRAYEPDGLTPAQFDTYGATVRTLRGFIASHHELIRVIREDYMLPNPDVK